MFDKIKKLQNLQRSISDMKQALATEGVEGTDESGKIKINMNGNQEVLNVSVEPELLSRREELESGLSQAFNDAVKKSQQLMMDKMKNMQDIPGLSL
ncbi:YbaB/EbfC family nucleoid-associated protein [Patescibacteria group bacterium]|nr:YbaB/EbfC family nucleoid-associated protein [Patescibacteria group bacterium]MBU1922573.1 YbaB/EbfC family nucleoid-associated protein [Patescibacteria group bacterium]